jgi:hypothetical protein
MLSNSIQGEAAVIRHLGAAAARPRSASVPVVFVISAVEHPPDDADDDRDADGGGKPVVPDSPSCIPGYNGQIGGGFPWLTTIPSCRGRRCSASSSLVLARRVRDGQGYGGGDRTRLRKSKFPLMGRASCSLTTQGTF